jgi:hypothetical protein
MAAAASAYCHRMNSLAILLVALFTLNCFTSEQALPGITGTGQISGKVVGADGTPISGVTVTTSHNGEVLTATTSSSGLFSFTLKEVQRGMGFNLQFTKTNFENASRAAVISLPNLKVDIGNVVMYITGSNAELSARKITGQVLDNFSYRPLAGANVTTTDSAGQVLVVTTDDNGRFALVSNYFALGSTFALGVFKSNYISRTDIIAVITAEENTIRNNPIRLYQKFGAIYGYVTEDSLGTPLNMVEVTLTNSNNQQITCYTGGNGGTYDPEPLAPGFYCPDMDDDPGTPNYGANGGGFKIKDQFLLLGNRYPITLSKTSTNCTNRAPAATNCYKTKTTYADVLLTGNNAIPGLTQALYWDSWIYGTVSAGAGVKVKLYNNSNTFITETTSGAGGAFLLDHPQIARAQTYKLTFEKNGYSSRLIGNSPPNDPVLVTISVAGPNNVGAVTMTALPPPNQTIIGSVTDYWSTQIIPGALVSITDNNGLRTATTDAFGAFSISGNFTCGNNYVMQISKAGYTGERVVAYQSFKISLPMDAFLNTSGGGCTRLAGPPEYNLASASSCDAEGTPGVGAQACSNYTVLYPIGLFANISGAGVLNPGLKRFQYQVKQTYEKFLTEKVGLTISGRMGALQLTSSAPQKNWDYDTLYVHFDDTPRILPNPPEGKWSNHVPVNPLPTTCTPTVTENCSPRANGALAEGIGSDTRTIPWDIKSYIYYHFYAAAPGSYTMETTGSTDTHITLYAQTGANLGSDDDSGSGSNARLTMSLSRGWYYIKVRGKNDNVFGFFDVRVTGPVAAEINYGTMLSPTATYATNCGPNNGNLVLSYYDATAHLLYIAAPGEGGSCSANATIEKHGPVGDIVRGRFDGSLRPIAPAGANATISSVMPTRGFFNIIRQE